MIEAGSFVLLSQIYLEENNRTKLIQGYQKLKSDTLLHDWSDKESLKKRNFSIYI